MQAGSQSRGQEQLLKEITKLLQKSKISYMVTGALSVTKRITMKQSNNGAIMFTMAKI